MLINEFVKQKRQEKGFSQDLCAAALGYKHSSSFQRRENGDIKFSYDQLCILATLFGLTENGFFNEYHFSARYFTKPTKWMPEKSHAGLEVFTSGNPFARLYIKEQQNGQWYWVVEFHGEAETYQGLTIDANDAKCLSEEKFETELFARLRKVLI